MIAVVDADVRFEFDERATRKAIVGDPGMRSAILDAAQELVPAARGRAPKLTGEGAASIHAEPHFDSGEWTARLGWERDNYYMSFHSQGTRTLPARPFLLPDGSA